MISIDEFTISTDHYIGGKRFSSAKTFTDISPIDGRVLGEVSAGGQQEADLAVAAEDVGVVVVAIVAATRCRSASVPVGGTCRACSAYVITRLKTGPPNSPPYRPALGLKIDTATTSSGLSAGAIPMKEAMTPL